ncbi:MAG: leucyl/phenylalanyl-tRNA--protein transferase [Desulfovibrio sp.]
MTIFRLIDEPVFPHPEESEPDGLLAVGGDLSLERLLVAYSNGIFPWYCEDSPILWWSPDPRLVLIPNELHVPRSLRRVINGERFSITYDTSFEKVIENCAFTPRPDQEGSWILPEMRDAYLGLHRLGFAHSVEAWLDGELVGGLYGIALGAVFFGESMFFQKPDASKVAFVHLVRKLQSKGIEIIDCQQTTDHLLRFGAREIPRSEFLDILSQCIHNKTWKGSWTEDQL